jgi:hypothetical protein
MEVWERMVWEGREKIVFWEGSVKSATEFVLWLKLPTNHPVFLTDEAGKPVFVAWLNRYDNGTALAHFCALGRYRIGSIETTMRYWAGLKNGSGEPVMHTFIGMIPSFNQKAIRLVEKCGWHSRGEIPGAFLLESGQRDGATILYSEAKDWR